ncbi:MAG TPA: T9SS type A sorting domain-containing protein [Tenuifilaceae bacterium]|nr:T9SS type A sorting domain-containing protein [Tenuifilaceae bacterium]HPE18980.1 T9SS type A sorting domain-containing protein [Tenuifilaceae bacterium]HPJ44635.1 T9SS type A sorting domain-containing protein [Tenuifilaceae bacterium]HPQ33963.1 T9SS type A sorting domain-containing protein [Tenuifilaceae bacterium]HRX69012.1 T9SS type A sorting domain-containing protein [Tenuifilaceae bacterium]
MKKLSTTLLLVLGFFFAQAQTSILEVISPAGGYVYNSDAGISVSWTLGEPVVGTLINETEGIIITQGFQQGDFVIVDVPVDPNLILSAKLYPNPAKDETTIKITLPTIGRVNLSVIDITGRIIITDQFEATDNEISHRLNVSSLRAGIYLVKLNVGTKASKVLKLIKE